MVKVGNTKPILLSEVSNCERSKFLFSGNSCKDSSLLCVLVILLIAFIFIALFLKYSLS